MTREQKEWLDSHKGHQPVSRPPVFGTRHAKKGMLHADGTFEPLADGGRPNIRQGSFQVAVIEVL
jgi:hypothetical protein